MKERFDQILDECIDRILLRGETVESCLARFPDYRAELAPELRLVMEAAGSVAFTPSAGAKERGRRRLKAGLGSLQKEQRGARWQTLRPFWDTGWLPRWALASLALSITLLVGATATAWASSDSLPGERLYPIKLAIEQSRLVLPLSQESKAILHLSYADRRTQEIVALMRSENTPLLQPTLERPKRT